MPCGCIIMISMWEVTENKNIFFLWVRWHYISQVEDIIKKWKNVILFTANYFSLPLLIKTYFSPWRRYKWSYGRGFNLTRYLEVLLSNIFSRFMGALMRTFLIILGTLCEILVFVLGFTVVILWIILPLATIIGVLFFII